MPSKVYDRDEWLGQRPQRNAEATRKRNAEYRAIQRGGKGGAFKDFWQALWGGIFRMGMYSSDPEIARIGMIQTVTREVANQRAITVTNRAEDQAREEARQRADEARMRTMARVMAQEMFDEAERRRPTSTG